MTEQEQVRRENRMLTALAGIGVAEALIFGIVGWVVGLWG